MNTFCCKQSLVKYLLLCVLSFATYSAQAKSHPYLFYTDKKIDRLKERIKVDTLLANNWNKVYARCEQWVKADKGGNIEQLAFAYSITKDNRFANRAKQLLLDLVAKKQWDGMDDRSPRWNSGLNTSHTNWLVSTTYDAIYNTLTTEERKHIASKIVQLGIEPSMGDWTSSDKRIHSLNSMGHNWWAAVVFEAGIASLAIIDEVPEAKKMGSRHFRI